MNHFYKKYSGLCLVITMLMCNACANYRIVKAYEIANIDSDKVNESFYAIAKNNVIVPEYVIDKNGRYPSTKEDAWIRFENRKEKLEPVVNKKYRIPNSLVYQSKRYVLMVGLIAVSPIVIPIMYISERFQDEDERMYGGSFTELVRNYFSISVNEPIKSEPLLKDEFEIVNIL